MFEVELNVQNPIGLFGLWPTECLPLPCSNNVHGLFPVGIPDINLLAVWNIPRVWNNFIYTVQCPTTAKTFSRTNFNHSCLRLVWLESKERLGSSANLGKSRPTWQRLASSLLFSPDLRWFILWLLCPDSKESFHRGTLSIVRVSPC